MQPQRYQVGDSYVCRAEFRLSETNALADPLTITVTVRRPDGTIADVTYPSASLSRVALGVYRLVVDVDVAGIWRVRWRSTGDAKAAEQTSFVADDPNV